MECLKRHHDGKLKNGMRKQKCKYDLPTSKVFYEHHEYFTHVQFGVRLGCYFKRFIVYCILYMFIVFGVREFPPGLRELKTSLGGMNHHYPQSLIDYLHSQYNEM